MKKQQTTIRFRLLIAGLICLLAGSALATDAEREGLARIAHEIDKLEPLVASAEADWLRQDLSRIREGLLEHANADRNEPRAVAPLRGDYRR